ncbi:MAG: hypothetical protein QG626_339 [Patescibacteria group bacterium]|nr:hypothetical protein [Patescibacteria group bacterium]
MNKVKTMYPKQFFRIDSQNGAVDLFDRVGGTDLFQRSVCEYRFGLSDDDRGEMAVIMPSKTEQWLLTRDESGNSRLRRDGSTTTFALEQWGDDGFWTASEQLAEQIQRAWRIGHESGRITALASIRGQLEALLKV